MTMFLLQLGQSCWVLLLLDINLGSPESLDHHRTLGLEGSQEFRNSNNGVDVIKMKTEYLKGNHCAEDADDCWHDSGARPTENRACATPTCGSSARAGRCVTSRAVMTQITIHDSRIVRCFKVLLPALLTFFWTIYHVWLRSLQPLQAYNYLKRFQIYSTVLNLIFYSLEVLKIKSLNVWQIKKRNYSLNTKFINWKKNFCRAYAFFNFIKFTIINLKQIIERLCTSESNELIFCVFLKNYFLHFGALQNLKIYFRAKNFVKKCFMKF